MCVGKAFAQALPLSDCASGCCIKFVAGPFYSCELLSDNSALQRFGREKTSMLCVNQDPTITSVGIKECCDNYCVQTLGNGDQLCSYINGTVYVGRDALTFACLTNSQAASNNVMYCAKGFCVWTDGALVKSCVPLNDVTNDKRFGKQLTDHTCLDQFPYATTTLGIIECYKRYCIYTDTSGGSPVYSCKALTTTDPTLIGKDSVNGQCLALNAAPSENCAYGYICLDPVDFKCKFLDAALTAWYGRDATTDQCITLNVGNAALCKGP